MVQMRLMGDDEERTRATMEVVLRILRESGEVQVGDMADLGMRRGPGARLVADVSLPAAAGGRSNPIRVRAEREDQFRGRSVRRALPPGRSEIE